MRQVVSELEQHFKDNPSHNASDSPVHDVAVLGREVGYEHAIKERMLDLAPHFEVYGAQDTLEMLTLIMKNGELSKELQDWDEGGFAHVPRIVRSAGDDVSAGEDAAGGEALESALEREGVSNLWVHGKGFDAVVNHHENLETRRRQHFYEKMDSFIRRGTQWAALMKVYSQVGALFQDARYLRRTLVRLLQLAAGPATLEEAPAAGAWLQHFVQFMVAGTELAEQLHKAHTQYGKILVRRILCALWNKQLDERR